MKYYIIAGEASGDLHASNLMKEISANDKEALYKKCSETNKHKNKTSIKTNIKQ